MSDERKIAGASYVLNFYQAVEQLNNNYVAYCNFVAELEQRSSTGFAGDMESRQILIQLLQNLRQDIKLTYIKYVAIKSATDNHDENKQLEGSYLHCMEHFVFERSEVEKYVKELNKFMLLDVIHSLLQNSETIIQELYQAENAK